MAAETVDRSKMELDAYQETFEIEAYRYIGMTYNKFACGLVIVFLVVECGS